MKNTDLATPAQLRKLRVLYNQWHVSDDERRALQQRETGKSSSTQLTVADARKLILYFEGQHQPGRDWQPQAKPAPRPRKPKVADDAPISEEQQQTILKMSAERGFDTAKRRMEFCLRQTKKRWPETNADAKKIIGALAAMRRAGRTARTENK